jgi:hypothetical protein
MSDVEVEALAEISVMEQGRAVLPRPSIKQGGKGRSHWKTGNFQALRLAQRTK